MENDAVNLIRYVLELTLSLDVDQVASGSAHILIAIFGLKF